MVPPIDPPSYQKGLLERKLPLSRVRFLMILLVGGGIFLIVWDVYLLTVKKDFLQQNGEKRYERVLTLPATRGRILDRNGTILAVSTPVKAIWASPVEAKLSPQQTRQLAELLNEDVASVHQKLSNNKTFVYLKRQLPPSIADKILAMQLPGIHALQEYRRFYPMGATLAHVIGFTNVEDKGQEGVELAFQKQLAGKNGTLKVIRNRQGKIIEELGTVPPVEGLDLKLSIDARIQHLAYSVIKNAVKEHHAKAGGAIVLDAQTGEILALVNTPSFNPNNRIGLSGEQLRNRVITDVFEPGSTMKPFSVSTALEKGLVTPNTKVDTGNGRKVLFGRTISDVSRNGVITVTQVIEKSSNIGTAMITSALKPKELWQTFHGVGFGQQPDIGFPGAARGVLRNSKTWRPIEQATMSYGYGLSVSLLQLSHAYCLFTRNGEQPPPLSLVKLTQKPGASPQILSEKTTKEMRAMLLRVIEFGGGRRAKTESYTVAGKSGTAKKIQNGHYVNKYVADFVGFSPIDKPRIIVAAMVDEPTGVYYGGAVAAPVVSKIVEGTLSIMGVKPDKALAPLQITENADKRRINE